MKNAVFEGLEKWIKPFWFLILKAFSNILDKSISISKRKTWLKHTINCNDFHYKWSMCLCVRAYDIKHVFVYFGVNLNENCNVHPHICLFDFRIFWLTECTFLINICPMCVIVCVIIFVVGNNENFIYFSNRTTEPILKKHMIWIIGQSAVSFRESGVLNIRAIICICQLK